MASMRTAIRIAATCTAAALTLTLTACGSGSSPASRAAGSNSSSTGAQAAKAPAAGTLSVAISNYAYHPDTITVAPGTTVTFTNHDQTPHTATSTGHAFDTGTLKPGQRFIIHLDKPGTYTFYCQFHAFMRGTIVVK